MQALSVSVGLYMGSSKSMLKLFDGLLALLFQPERASLAAVGSTQRAELASVRKYWFCLGEDWSLPMFLLWKFGDYGGFVVCSYGCNLEL